MTDRLTEIRARLDAATPGPWGLHPDEPWVMGAAMVAATGLTVGRDDPDADLIAHAPADIAWLLAEVERLSAPPRRCIVCNRVEVAP